MNEPKPYSSRQTALAVLNKCDIRNAAMPADFDKLITQTDRKGQASDIIFGVIRNHTALDMIITKFGKLGGRKVDKPLFNILRLGAYELIYSPQTAQYAIVNEAAQLATNFGGKKQVGFINAVLREIERAIDKRTAPILARQLQKTLPQTIDTGCVFKDDILPAPVESSSGYLSAAFSLPSWLVQDWLDRFGFDTAREICFASNRKPDIFLRANKLKISGQQLCEKLQNADFEAQLVSNSIIKVKRPGLVCNIEGFDAGEFSVQDPTATESVKGLDLKSGLRVLDFCSAPGGKTTQMAELMGDSGQIIATDIDSQRLKKVEQNCKRLGISIVKTIPYADIDQAGLFDVVLLDVPCSNTGVLARRPQVRHRITPQAVTGLADTQLKILNRAVKFLAPAGRICYSTCSICQQECSGLLKRFIAENADFVVESEKLTLPTAAQQHYSCDGGFSAIISRK
jgi:16S rRNA (cytosine967-C5)-methyltransferase